MTSPVFGAGRALRVCRLVTPAAKSDESDVMGRQAQVRSLRYVPGRHLPPCFQSTNRPCLRSCPSWPRTTIPSS
ncbi:protein of unknown function [Ralstonia solanacearum CMR15]|nr:protein of unknown function [Ralstonia solanacearum CMR15]